MYFFFQFKNQDLFGVAFIDSQIYVHTLCCMKSFILVGDVMKSIDLLQFQQGTIHILRKHLYTTKFDLTTFDYFFSSKRNNLFFSIAF